MSMSNKKLLFCVVNLINESMAICDLRHKAAEQIKKMEIHGNERNKRLCKTEQPLFEIKKMASNEICI